MNISEPILMVFGNVFAFNSPLVREMKAQWKAIGEVITDADSLGQGCPVISGRRAHQEGHCEQDMVYAAW